jgi:hypothetical protein
LIDTAEVTEDLWWRQNVQSAAREWGVDVRQVKPCAAQIREVEDGRRNEAAYILGTEWRRMGLTQDRALKVAERWNDSNLPPLTIAGLHSNIRSAYRGENEYGCNGPLADWCIGRDECPYHQRFVSGPKPVTGRTTMVDFERLGWRSPHVTPGQRLVYSGIVRMEAIRDVGPGGCVITSLRQMARLIGLSASGVRQALLLLDLLGLIDYSPGRRRATGLPPKGCTTRRIIPIPGPPVRNPGWGREVRRRLRRPRAPASISSPKTPQP